MAITIFGRGYPLSAVDDGSTLKVSYKGTAIFDISDAGISANGIVADTVSGTVATSATILYPTFSTRAGKILCAGYGAPGKLAATCFSSDGYLSASFGGNSWYIPCMSSVTWQT